MDQLDEILTLYARCVEHLESQGIDQWGAFYPTEEILRQDLEQGYLYLYIKNGQIIGAVSLNERQPEVYGLLPWSIRNGKILVVHRLIVDPKLQGQG